MSFILEDIQFSLHYSRNINLVFKLIIDMSSMNSKKNLDYKIKLFRTKIIRITLYSD